MTQPRDKYTQKQWDREIGYGTIPEGRRYAPPAQPNHEKANHEKAYDEAKRVVGE